MKTSISRALGAGILSATILSMSSISYAASDFTCTVDFVLLSEDREVAPRPDPNGPTTIILGEAVGGELSAIITSSAGTHTVKAFSKLMDSEALEETTSENGYYRPLFEILPDFNKLKFDEAVSGTSYMLGDEDNFGADDKDMHIIELRGADGSILSRSVLGVGKIGICH